MASLNANKGNRRIQFKAPDGKRKTIYLGKLPKRQAQTVKGYVDRLIVAAVSGDSIDVDTAAWLRRITDELQNKLAGVGLIPKRITKTLGEFLNSYIAKRNIKKLNTLRNYNRIRDFLIRYFGESKNLRNITAGDADDWRQWMLASQAETTVSREVRRAKQFFKAAVRKRLIPENPFADLPAPEQVNNARDFFVTSNVARKVLDACPDAESRLIFALCRYGGLRCPSEVVRLTWGDVDWSRNRLTIHASNTAHHKDGGIRQIPIFPELRRHLEDVWQLAEEGATHVITRYRQPNANPGTQLRRIIKRAGLERWPKLFQNLRASRETELADEFPPHVVSAWIGDSQEIAKKHYLQVTEEHFKRAIRPMGGATQNPTHAAPVRGCKASSEQDEAPAFAEKYEGLPYYTAVHIPPRGVEPLSSD